MNVNTINVNDQHQATFPNIGICESDFDIQDTNGNILTQFKDGHIKTKNFNSASIIQTTDCIADLEFIDSSSNCLLWVNNGHIKTKNFSSNNISKDVQNHESRILTLENQELLSRHFGTFSVLGDSYSTFYGYTTQPNASQWYPSSAQHQEGHNDVVNVEQQWWHLFATEYKSLLVENESWSGSPISYDGWGTGTSDAKSYSFITRASNIGKPELLIIFGGTNDAWIGVQQGEYQYSDWTDEDLCKVRPALAKLLDELINDKNHIGMQILFMNNSELSAAFNESAQTVCEHYNVPFLQLQSISKKGNHPDAAGMISIKNQLINKLKNLN